MNMMITSVTKSLPSIRLTFAAALCVIALGCSNIEKAPPQPISARADRSIELSVPRIMRGTINSEAILLGYRPVVVQGYGLVVGLKGTGTRAMPPGLRAYMLGEMGRRGLGQQSQGFGNINPEEMLNSLNTAVVVVEGVIPPGAVGRQITRGMRIDGTKFDVRVYAHPSTDTSSLEGGRLYTTDLRPVVPGQELLPPTGSRQAAGIAEAVGPIFLNPYAQPQAVELDAVDRRVGRIMSGGEVLKDIPVKLRLATPSHARATIMQDAINNRFPREPGQRDPTAWGESDEKIEITVPMSFRNRPDEFIELLKHASIQQIGAERIADGIKRIVIDDPTFAEAASWRWEAIGVRALPTLRELYDHPDVAPRLAALRAGARMDDPLTVPPLIAMTKDESALNRRQAVTLLEEIESDPRIDLRLANMLNDAEPDVRLAAYEALVARHSRFVFRTFVDDKFELHLVESDYPMVYIAQVGRPRIALFGKNLSLDVTKDIELWGGRFMINAARDGASKIEVFYRNPDTGETLIELTDPQLASFIHFLAHRTTIERPAPGLGLSYSETVGAIYRLVRLKAIAADFVADQDRVVAAILRLQEQGVITDRPEFEAESLDPDFDAVRPEGGGEPPLPAVTETQVERDGLDGLAPPPSLDGGDG